MIVSQGHEPCLVVQLTNRHTEFSAALLDMIVKITENMVILMDDSEIDFSQWKSANIHLFATGDLISSLRSKPDHVITYALDKSASNNIKARSFTSIDTMIHCLIDQVLRNIGREVEAWKKMKEPDEVKASEKKIKEIYQQVRMVDMRVNHRISDTEKLRSRFPCLCWLSDSKVDDERDRNNIEEHFGNTFSHYKTFRSPHRLHEAIAMADSSLNFFLIIHTSYPQELIWNFRKFNNVKCVLKYDMTQKHNPKTDHPDKSKPGSNVAMNNQCISSQDDLIFHLSWNLMDYCHNMAQQYQSRNELTEARDMFAEVKRLCDFISKHFFRPIK